MQKADDKQTEVLRSMTPAQNLALADGFLKLIIALRGDKPFIPRGIHKFKSFEEAQSWSLKMMTRKRVGEEE